MAVEDQLIENRNINGSIDPSYPNSINVPWTLKSEDTGVVDGSLTAETRSKPPREHDSSVPCKVAVGALLSERGKEHQPTLPVVRSLLSDALRIDPTNRKAWYYLGLVHKYDERIADATDCFQSMLEESDPIESFSTNL
uniref:Uncharacterized protein n=1 Tax=Brassica campestris TaxID=3711 RepID=M4DCJ2_BRACM